MATIQRPVKTYGNRNYVAEVAAAPGNQDPILATEVDADIDTVYGAWNAGVDTVNIKDGSVTKAKLAPDANLWNDTGTALVPASTPRNVSAPPRCSMAGGTQYGEFCANTTTTPAYDNTKPGYLMRGDYTNDAWQVWRASAGASPAWTNLVNVAGATGDTTVTGRLRGKCYGGGIWATNQAIASGQTVQLLMTNQWYDTGSMTSAPGAQLWSAPWGGVVVVGLRVDASPSNGFGWGILIQKWNGTAWDTVGTEWTTSQTTLTLTSLYPVAASQQFRGVITNAISGGATLNVSYQIMQLVMLGAT